MFETKTKKLLLLLFAAIGEGQTNPERAKNFQMGELGPIGNLAHWSSLFSVENKQTTSGDLKEEMPEIGNGYRKASQLPHVSLKTGSFSKSNEFLSGKSNSFFANLSILIDFA